MATNSTNEQSQWTNNAPQWWELGTLHKEVGDGAEKKPLQWWELGTCIRHVRIPDDTPEDGGAQ